MIHQSKEMAILRVWLEVVAQKYDPAAPKLIHDLLFKTFFGMTTDSTIMEEYEGKLGKVLDVHEMRLGQSKYLGGDSFTLADLHNPPTLNELMGNAGEEAG